MSRGAAGVFVTGTGTGVGKTVVACALIRALRARGIDVGAMKPVETGVGADGPQDAQALRAATGEADPLADVCPYAFALPAAPSVAAAREGRSIDVTRLVAGFETLAGRHAYVVVEGAGGLRVPLRGRCDMRELAAHLGLPVLLVARAALGTINHTLLSLDALAARGLRLAGVVINHADGRLSDADAENLTELRHELGARLVGEIPWLPAGASPPETALAVAALLRAGD